MGGGGRYPTKPRRLITFSRDKLGLSNGGGIVGLFFGSLFSLSGLLVIGLTLATVLDLQVPYVISVPNDANRGSVFVLLIGLLLGGGHLTGGSLMLSTLRCTIDRRRQTVTVRSGWLGRWKKTAVLTDFDRVMVFPSARYKSQSIQAFDIVLAGKRDRCDNYLTVGFATVKSEGAEEMTLEISKFSGLPVG